MGIILIPKRANLREKGIKSMQIDSRTKLSKRVSNRLRRLKFKKVSYEAIVDRIDKLLSFRIEQCLRKQTSTKAN